jgi:hypothetical protein
MPYVKESALKKSIDYNFFGNYTMLQLEQHCINSFRYVKVDNCISTIYIGFTFPHRFPIKVNYLNTIYKACFLKGNINVRTCWVGVNFNCYIFMILK